MTAEMVCEIKSEKIEQLLLFIAVKLALLTAMKVIEHIVKAHSSYKNTLRKKYTEKDVAATILRNTTHQATSQAHPA